MTDPQYQLKFTYAWASVAGAFVLFALPRVYKSLRDGSVWTSVTGLTEDLYGESGPKYDALLGEDKLSEKKRSSSSSRSLSRLRGVHDSLKAIGYWTAPVFDLDVGQSELKKEGKTASVMSLKS